jgi:hypothetical protein
MTPNRTGKAVAPGLGGYDSEVVELTGGPDWMLPMPPARSRGKLTPLGTGEPADVPARPGPGERLKRPKRPRGPLVPTVAEVAALPAGARVALAARCALRVKPIRPDGIASPADAARALLDAATTDTPLAAQLRCVRRDFLRLQRLAREHHWTDDTPVPPDAFGPVWPDGLAPDWWTEPTA